MDENNTFNFKQINVNIRRWFIGDEPSKLQWIASSLIIVLIFFTMGYYDNRAIFLGAIAKLQEIPEKSIFTLFSDWELPYGLIHNLLCVIWDIPVYFLNIIFGISPSSMGALLWYKLCVVFFYILDIIQLKKIAHNIEIEQKSIRWVLFYFSTTLLVILPVYHIAQTDAVYLFFVLMGFNAYLQNDYKCFLLCFAIAIPMKYIPIFIYVPLVLLKQKKILYIIRDLLASMSIIILGKILEIFSSKIMNYFYGIKVNHSHSGSFLSGNLSRIFGSRVDVIFHKEMQASIFLILFILLCVWVYLQNIDDDLTLRKKAVYFALAGIAPMFIFGSTPVYWIVIIFPFIFLLIFLNKKIFVCNMVLVNSFVLPYFYISTITNNWVLGGNETFDTLLLSFIRKQQMSKGQEAPSFNDYLIKFGLDQYTLIAASFATASLIALLIINSGYVKVKNPDYKISMYQHGFAWFNITLLYGWFFINLATVLNIF